MNVNMELVFDIVFNNEKSFDDITVEKAKMLVCTYKPAIEQSNIITPIEIDNGRELCNLVYNNIIEMIITAKYTMFQNRKNSKKKTVSYDIYYTEIVEKYNKFSDIARKEFNYVIVSDYLEFLKTCVLYNVEKEDVLIAEKYKNLLDMLDIELTKDIIADYSDSTMPFIDLNWDNLAKYPDNPASIMKFENLYKYYVEQMLEIHANF